MEFALVLPLLLILIANVVNFGSFFFAWVTVASAARAGSQYLVRADAALSDSTTAPTLKTASQVATDIVTPEVSTLLNKASLAVRVCSRSPNSAADTRLQSLRARPRLVPSPLLPPTQPRIPAPRRFIM